MRTYLNGRMAKVISIEEKDKGEKEVLFIVADRQKRKLGKEYISDFYLCKAKGFNAERIINDFCMEDKDGKLISRKINIAGKGITYKKEEEQIVEASLSVKAKALTDALGLKCPKDKQEVNVNLAKKERVIYNVTNFMIYVTDIEYEDKRPDSEEEEEETVIDSSTCITIDC
ncbi:MAG: hypothetical protein ACRDBY_08640 [Cetobacterium sp.]